MPGSTLLDMYIHKARSQENAPRGHNPIPDMFEILCQDLIVLILGSCAAAKDGHAQPCNGSTCYETEKTSHNLRPIFGCTVFTPIIFNLRCHKRRHHLLSTTGHVERLKQLESTGSTTLALALAIIELHDAQLILFPTSP